MQDKSKEICAIKTVDADTDHTMSTVGKPTTSNAGGFRIWVRRHSDLVAFLSGIVLALVLIAILLVILSWYGFPLHQITAKLPHLLIV